MSNNNELGNIAFDLPKNQSNVIKVIGVGGGGSNAINHMFSQGIKGVDFVVCNTDSQALQSSSVPNKIQLGVNLTEGLGAGANPEVGEQAALESREDIRRMLDTNTKMVFITAGMGGGTGTGAAPVIAKMAKEMDILTVGIVTMPFQFEGRTRNAQAQQGIEKLRSHVDSLVVINNNKLREVYGNLGFKAGFSKADEVLATASRGIAEVITHHYTQNIDLRDAKTVLSNSGTAIMGSATASGETRAAEAIKNALDSPLLNDNKITGAKNVLLLIVSGPLEITIDEIGEINDHIQNEAGHSANIIMGVGDDDTLEDAISVTIIATGFDLDQQDEISNTEVVKVVHSLENEVGKVKNVSIHNPAPTHKAVAVPTAPASEVVRHTLSLDDTPKAEAQTVMDIIPTSTSLKGMDVAYDEVLNSKEVAEADDFVITSVDDAPGHVETPVEQEEQITLTFDMPINAPISEVQAPKTDAKTHFNLNEGVNAIEVNDPVEVTTAPQAQVNGTNEKRYALGDYMEVESSVLEQKAPVEAVEEVEEVEEAIVFERKTVVASPVDDSPSQEIDPMHTPLSELLKERADERRRKMKDFNYKFNTAKIDEIERQPAYKRQGLSLDNTPHSSDTSASRLSVGTDDNDDIQLRRNNSYLHDNVD